MQILKYFVNMIKIITMKFQFYRISLPVVVGMCNAVVIYDPDVYKSQL